MDKIKLLQERKRQLLNAGKNIRRDIDVLVDNDSFVELSSFSFSESEFYDGTAAGEGVVCGFATISDYPYYIIAQNYDVLSGGVSKANCEKMLSCLEQAEKNQSPVVYILSSLGVRVGEGVNVLEGIAKLIKKATDLKSVVPQYLIVNGEVYGQSALLAGICDFTFFIDKKSVLALNSPLVISASAGLNLAKEKVGGAGALTHSGLTSFTVKDLVEAKGKIDLINQFITTPLTDCEELNIALPALNKKCDAKSVLAIFDKNSVLEVGATYFSDIKCCLGRIGGISVAAVIFDGGEEGVKLSPEAINKINDFADFACSYNLPYLTFVNAVGADEKPQTADSRLIKNIGEYVGLLGCMSSAKISVVYGKSIGLGYTLFAAKSMGYDYTYAFANAEIALFSGVQGAEIEFASEKNTDKAKLAKKYSEENADPVNAAKGGYVDNIIEPSFVRQYLIASLQMLIK